MGLCDRLLSVPGGGPVAVSRFGCAVASQPPLGTARADVVAIPATVAPPLPVVAQPLAGQRFTAGVAVCVARAAGPRPGAQRADFTPTSAGNGAVAVAAAASTADGGPGRR